MAEVHKGDREEHGMQGGKFPCATGAQCMSAIKLRHHGKGVSAEAVLSHVLSAASGLRKSGKLSPAAYERIKNKVAEARKMDKGSHA
jgi:hypothetical protein